MDTLISPMPEAMAGWRDMPAVMLIARTLGEGNARIVGGAVRDTLCQLRVSDIDFATSLSPEDVIAKLEAARIKAVPTGIAHGTVTAALATGAMEITTLRRDVSTDGRRATVAFTDNWREDAARRDFTINALYADPFTGEVFDYFGGYADLQNGIVRFIGDPLTRIAEDHLRIMRFFRFHARFAKGMPDAAAIEACAARANDLMALSRERIADELLKLLALPDAAATVALMLDHGILKPVLPEIVSADGLSALGDADAVRRLAGLLPPDPEVADRVAKRLKLSKAMIKRLVLAAGRNGSDITNPRALAYWIGLEGARDRLHLLGADDAYAALEDWRVPTFPMTGGAIVARGVSAGPDVARVLKAIERQWVEEGFPGPERLEAIADALV
jgi:poly(A) polymerase